MSYFHIGREHDEPMEETIKRNLIAARNRASADDESNERVVEADGWVTEWPRVA